MVITNNRDIAAMERDVKQLQQGIKDRYTQTEAEGDRSDIREWLRSHESDLDDIQRQVHEQLDGLKIHTELTILKERTAILAEKIARYHAGNAN